MYFVFLSNFFLLLTEKISKNNRIKKKVEKKENNL